MANSERSWVIDIRNQLKDVNTSAEVVQWTKHSIYKVPSCIKDLNPKVYKPQVVSFGPYHYGEEQLKPMEAHKHRALLHFLKRVDKPFEEFVSSLEEVVEELQDCFQSLEEKWKRDKEEFLKLMIVDGCFMIEILTIATGGRSTDYAFNDPVFSSHGILHTVPYIKRDMLMIENQLPLLVLEKLVAVETGKAPVSIHLISFSSLFLFVANYKYYTRLSRF